MLLYCNEITTKSDYLRIINLARLRNISLDKQFNFIELEKIINTNGCVDKLKTETITNNKKIYIFFK